MLRLFNTNRFVSYVLLVPLLALMNLRDLLQPPLAAEQAQNTAVWQTLMWCLPTTGLGAVVAKLVVIALIMFFVTALVNVNRFTEHPNALGGMFYALLSAAFALGKGLMPIHIYALCGIISIYRLFGAARQQQPMRSCFAATAWYMFGCFFWAKGVWFLPFFWLAFALQRIATLRTFVASLLGAALPCAIAATYFFLTENYLSATNDYLAVVFSHSNHISLPTAALVYMCIILLFIVIAVVGAQSKISTLKISQSLNYRTLIAMGAFAVAMYFTPYFSLSTQMPIAIVGAVFLAAFVQRINHKLTAEIITAIVAVVCFLAQWEI